MRIYVKSECIVFECNYCGLKQGIAPAKSKRAFMITLNRFARQHDNSCKWIHQRNDSIALSATVTDEIIKKLSQFSH